MRRKKPIPGARKAPRRKYKDPQWQAFYDRLRALGSPEELKAAGIFGAFLDAFTCGWKGLPVPVRFRDRTLARVAYYAGKDTRPILPLPVRAYMASLGKKSKGGGRPRIPVEELTPAQVKRRERWDRSKAERERVLAEEANDE